MAELIPITINKDGDWYYGSSKMFRKDIVALMADNIKKDSHGYYYIQYQGQNYPLQVEDVPFTVIRVTAVTPAGLETALADGRSASFHPGTVTMRRGVPYTSLQWELDTRFSRQAMWDLSSYLVEEENDEFSLQIGAARYPVKTL